MEYLVDHTEISAKLYGHEDALKAQRLIAYLGPEAAQQLNLKFVVRAEESKMNIREILIQPKHEHADPAVSETADKLLALLGHIPESSARNPSQAIRFSEAETQQVFDALPPLACQRSQ